MCQPVSLCDYFGCGTRLTVLGESPSCLLSLFFPPGLYTFLSLCSFLCPVSACVKPSTRTHLWGPDLLPSPDPRLVLLGTEVDTTASPLTPEAGE